MTSIFVLLVALLAIGLVVRRYNAWARLALVAVVAVTVVHICFM